MKQEDRIIELLEEIRDVMKEKAPAPAAPRKISDRYTDNGDGTVSDKLLSVVWVKDPSQIPGFEKTMPWDEAWKRCQALSYAGKKDWRLPTVEELRSIVDYTRFKPAWDTNVFGGKHDDWYWTGTTCVWESGAAWCVVSDDGYVSGFGKANGGCVRPVRSSQSRQFDPLPVRSK